MSLLSSFQGVPSLGKDLLGLVAVDGVRLKDPEDVRDHPVYKVVVGLAEELKGDSPVWSAFLSAQLFEAVGDYEAGIGLIDGVLGDVDDSKAKGDLLERKARLLKLSGDITSAVACMDVAREVRPSPL